MEDKKIRNYRIVVLLLIILLVTLVFYFKFLPDWQEKWFIRGFKQAERDYAEARAVPVRFNLINETTNEQQEVFLAVQTCSQDFQDNYQIFCGIQQ